MYLIIILKKERIVSSHFTQFELGSNSSIPIPLSPSHRPNLLRLEYRTMFFSFDLIICFSGKFTTGTGGKYLQSGLILSCFFLLLFLRSRLFCARVDDGGGGGGGARGGASSSASMSEDRLCFVNDVMICISAFFISRSIPRARSSSRTPPPKSSPLGETNAARDGRSFLSAMVRDGMERDETRTGSILMFRF